FLHGDNETHESKPARGKDPEGDVKAIIFDFDGVIANSEPAHFQTLQRVLAEEGIKLSESDYYRKYLALDDRGAFTAALIDAAREPDLYRVPEFIARKAHYFHAHL